MACISVIVPVYKVEPYLRRCVDSILGQTFTDFELILVDDGSPDGSPAICDEYTHKDRRVHVIHQENGGLSAARNAGIDWVFANSDSQWLTFVDSDDWIHPEMLERLYHAAVKLHVSVSVCGYMETAEEEVSVDIDQSPPQEWKAETFYVERNTNATVAWGKLYRISCFARIRYPIGKIHEDEYTTYQVLFALDKIAYIPDALYFYQVNNEGITKSAWTPKKLDAISAIEEQILFFHRHHYAQAYQKAVKRYLWLLCYNYRQANASPDINPNIAKTLQRKMRKTLQELRKRCCLSLEEYPWAYEAAYPQFMKYYWLFHALKSKFKKGG